MTQLMLLTHGDWGISLVESARMIVGNIHGVHIFPLYPEDALAGYTEKIRDALEKADGRQVLMISDLNGGTTSNVAAVLSRTYENVSAVCGLGMEMLIAASELREELEGRELVKAVLSWTAEKNRDLECD